jgi:hypothetical protein
MALKRWMGAAQAVALIQPFTIGTNDTSTTYSLTINGKTVSVVGQSAGASATAAAFTAALQLASGQASGGTVIPEFAELTWTNPSSNVVQAAGNTPGVPFAIQIGITGGSGNFAGYSDITAPTGPNYFDNPGNWDSGTAPAAGDTLDIDNNATSILYTSVSDATKSFAAVNIGAGFTGQIGLAQQNANGYQEYRSTSLAFETPLLTIGAGNGNGSPLIRLNLGTVACAATVYDTAPSAETGVEAVVLDFNNSSTTVDVVSGTVGIGVISKASGAIGTLSISAASASTGFTASQFTSSASTSVRIGQNVQVGPVNMSGGTLLVDTRGGATIGAINQTGGTISVIGSSGTATLNVYAGTCYWSSSGTIASAAIGPTGTLDFSQDNRTKTITVAVQMSAGARLNDPFGVVSGLAFKTLDCALSSVTVVAGFNHTYTSS